MINTKNGTKVFPLIFGGAGIGSYTDKLFFGESISNSRAQSVVKKALELGLNGIDTSPFYGNSEEKIGHVIEDFKNRDALLLSTKVGTHPTMKGYSANLVYRSVENSLKKLKTDYLDIVHIHDPSSFDLETALHKDGAVQALLDLKKQGVVRYLGLGVRSFELHKKFALSGFSDIQMPYLDYNLIQQSAADLLLFLNKKQIAVMMGSSLAMGLLSGVNPVDLNISHYKVEQEISMERSQKIYDWCSSKKIDIKALNFAFLQANETINFIVAGATTEGQVEDLVAAYKSRPNTADLEGFKKEFLQTT
jgi:D-threo-aldose 1-dehydrogenase